MKAIQEQNLKELAETLKNLGEDRLEEKGRILQELFRRRPTFDVELEAEVAEVFAKAAQELTSILDTVQVL
jgi:hypothetical protein